MTQVKSTQRIFVFLYSLSACILIMNPLIAIAPKDTQELKNNLRILELSLIFLRKFYALGGKRVV